MNNNNFLRIFSIIAFIAFMLVSCWATVESLYMSDPFKGSINSKIPYWVVTIGLFFISSLGATLVANSFNSRIRIENRGGKLIGGILLLLIFWLLFSMPTNTHTFFYSNKGEGLIQEDLRRTTMYLQQLSQEQVEQTILKVQSETDAKIRSAYQAFIKEYNSKANPGYGPYAIKNLNILNKLLAEYNVEGLREKNANHNDAKVRKKVIADYDTEIENYINLANEYIKQNILAEKGIVKKNADEVLDKLKKDESLMELYKDHDTTMAIGKMRNIVKDVQDGYKVIANHPEQVRFANNYDKQLYSGQTNEKGEVLKGSDGKVVAKECESARLFNAFSVWQDYFNGKFKGMGFFYWIMLAMLVDIGGFIFFTIAFRKTE